MFWGKATDSKARSLEGFWYLKLIGACMLVKVGFHIVVWFVQNDRVARFELDN